MTTIDESLTLRCGLEVPSRVALAPLTNTQSHADGTLGDDELRWLVRRAAGGFPWINTCAAYVSDEGKAWSGQLGIATDVHEEGLARLAAALGEHGAVSIVQLYHGGAKASLAPAKLTPENATTGDLERVTRDFVAAAQRAERAGFSGVEIHGANGYLFTQFLAPADNRRTDEYGGPLEGRARLLRETSRAVRAAVSPSFAVGVRLSPVDTWDQRGLVLADGVCVGQWLGEDGADFVHLSLRDAVGAPPFENEGPVARAFRDALPGEVPILAAGGIWTRRDAERAFAHGVDVAVLGRAAIGNPDWPKQSADSSWEPARPPWTREHLRHVAVGDAFVSYLSSFRTGSMVSG